MHSFWLASLLLFAAQRASAQCDNPTPAFCNIANTKDADWMGRLPDSRSISELSIPGTHESLAVVGGNLFECQEDYGNSAATLTTQLNSGIRAFDVRARITDGGKFTIHHASSYQNANFDDVLTKIRDFLGAHKGETVVMRLKQECLNEFPSCTDAAGDFLQIFNSYRSAYSSLFWAPSVDSGSANPPTLGEARGKLVLLVLNGRHGERIANYGLGQFSGWKDASSEYVQDEYNVPNMGAIATKRDQVRRFLDKTSAGDKSKIYVNFGSGSSVLAQPWQVAGGFPPFVTGVNPFLLGYLREGPEVHAPVVRTGIMMLDYPGPDLIKQIISVNAF